jgi:hypothetical protein
VVEVLPLFLSEGASEYDFPTAFREIDGIRVVFRRVSPHPCPLPVGEGELGSVDCAYHCLAVVDGAKAAAGTCGHDKARNRNQNSAKSFQESDIYYGFMGLALNQFPV